MTNRSVITPDRICSVALLLIAGISLLFAALGGGGLWISGAPSLIQMIGNTLTIYGVIALSTIGFLSILGLMVFNCCVCCCKAKPGKDIWPLEASDVSGGFPPTPKEDSYAFPLKELGGRITSAAQGTHEGSCAIIQEEGCYGLVFKNKAGYISFITSGQAPEGWPTLADNSFKGVYQYYYQYLRNYELQQRPHGK